jgi:hypothetical protein
MEQDEHPSGRGGLGGRRRPREAGGGEKRDGRARHGGPVNPLGARLARVPGAQYRIPLMATEEDDLIRPDETAYRLELTPAQLKITHTALKSLLDDFGHDEREVKRVVTEVLAKLPDESVIRSIDLERGT